MKHFPKGKCFISRQDFLRAFNALSMLHGGKGIDGSKLNNWLHRSPPDEWCGLDFSLFLEKVGFMEILKTEKIYRIDFPADARTVAALEKATADGGTPEQFLLDLLVLAIERSGFFAVRKTES